jgi:hypothetical protein
MGLPFYFLELRCEFAVSGAVTAGYMYKHESTTLKFHLAVRPQRTNIHKASCEM